MEYMKRNQALLQKELADYLKTEPVSRYEKKLLNKWVSEGHSIYEDPGSKYLCDFGIKKSFLERYREDRLIAQELKGKTKVEKEIFLRKYMGYDSESEEEPELDADQYIRQMEHELYFLWEFVQKEHLCERAHRYLNEHQEDDYPFAWQG